MSFVDTESNGNIPLSKSPTRSFEENEKSSPSNKAKLSPEKLPDDLGLTEVSLQKLNISKVKMFYYIIIII